MDTHYFGSRIRITVKNWIRIRIKVEIQELSRLKMRVLGPVVTDSHHVDEQDSDPHESEKLYPDPL